MRPAAAKPIATGWLGCVVPAGNATRLALGMAMFTALVGCGRIGYDGRDVHLHDGDGGPGGDSGVPWAHQFGGAGSELVNGVAVDDDGQVYLTGIYDAPFDFDGQSHSLQGARGLFVASYDVASGTPRWLHTYDGANSVEGRAVAVAGGLVHVTGFIAGTATFDDTPLGTPVGQDLLWLTLARDGTFSNASSYGDNTGRNAQGLAIDGQSAGGVAITGLWAGDLDLGDGSPGSRTVDGGFMAMFAADRRLQWTHTFDSDDNASAEAIGVDDAGQLCVAGRFDGTGDLGAGSFSANGRDGFVASMVSTSSLVTLRWVSQITGTNVEIARGAAPTTDGGCIVVGQFSGDLTLGQLTFATAGGVDGFVARFTASGEVAWVRILGGSQNGSLGAVDTNGEDMSVVGGQFSGATTFASAEVSSRGGTDGIVLTLAADGALIDAWVLGGPDADSVVDVAFDPGGGAVIAAGRFEGTAELDGEVVASAGGRDVFVIRLTR